MFVLWFTCHLCTTFYITTLIKLNERKLENSVVVRAGLLGLNAESTLDISLTIVICVAMETT